MCNRTAFSTTLESSTIQDNGASSLLTDEISLQIFSLNSFHFHHER